jgi:signal transduction histidine kinase
MLQYDDVSASDRDEYIGIINKSADRLMSTINDIVEISQIQTGQVKMIESEIIVRKLCNELVELFQSEAEIQGLNFVLRNDLPETIESITTDRFKLFAIQQSPMDGMDHLKI